MIDIEKLKNYEEIIGKFGTTKSYCEYQLICPDSACFDVSAAIEDTLHRIIEAGGTKEDICQILGAIIPNEEEKEELEEFQEYVSVDLNYVIPGLITFVNTKDYKEKKTKLKRKKYDFYNEEYSQNIEL